jgi:NAD(P)H-hydrate epimerase
MGIARRHSSVVLTVGEMSQTDTCAVASGVPSIELMENAGTAVAREIMRRWSPETTVILCGPGNNGGDGFVVARHLAAAGLQARVAMLGNVDNLKGDASVMAGRWEGAVEPLTLAGLNGADLVVDAVFGAGLARPLEGAAEEVFSALTDATMPCVAVDLPSGVDGNSGQLLGPAPKAALTVTFYRKKPGHLLYPGRRYAGDVVVADTGIPEPVPDEVVPSIWENGPDLWLDHYPWPWEDGHKYDRGHAVAVSGGPAATGAGRMAARAALRAGAGLVTMAVPHEALEIAAAQLTAVMVAPFEGADGLGIVLKDKRKNAILIGPGNGIGAVTRDNVITTLGLGRACVLDADALTSFEDDPGQLFRAIKGPTLLTPHAGEFERLFGSVLGPEGPAPEGKLGATRRAAQACGAVILLKGADTVIAAPDGRAVINSNATPELATAGSGDVLAGFALGLLAQGLTPFDAGCAAAWLHGEVGRELGLGLIAEDLADALPPVLKRLHGSDP